MSVYVCLIGDVQDIALSEPGAVTVTDTRGRTWCCHLGAEEDKNFGPSWIRAQEAQQRADEQGRSKEGLRIHVIDAEPHELAAKLGAIQ